MNGANLLSTGVFIFASDYKRLYVDNDQQRPDVVCFNCRTPLHFTNRDGGFFGISTSMPHAQHCRAQDQESWIKSLAGSKQGHTAGLCINNGNTMTLCITNTHKRSRKEESEEKDLIDKHDDYYNRGAVKKISRERCSIYNLFTLVACLNPIILKKSTKTLEIRDGRFNPANSRILLADFVINMSDFDERIIKKNNTDVMDGKVERGFWGAISGAVLKKDKNGAEWLNIYFINSGHRFSVKPDQVNDFLRRYNVAEPRDLTGKYIMTIGKCRSKIENKYAVFIDDPDKVAMLAKEQIEGSQIEFLSAMG